MNQEEDGNINVEGTKLLMKDEMATTGAIHVIEDVIIQESVMSVIIFKLLDLLNKTVPKELMDELVKDGKKLEEILLNHIAIDNKIFCHLSNNELLDTVGGQKLWVLHKRFGHMHAL